MFFEKEFNASTLPKIKFGVLVGHTVLKQGASTKRPPIGRDKNVFEYAYSAEMAQYLASDIHYAFNDFGGLKSACNHLKLLGCNGIVSHHLNAFNGNVAGAEFLFLDGDKSSEYYAVEIAQQFKSTFPERRLRHDNGLKPISCGQRGYHGLKLAKKYGMKIAIISECFFIDNSAEWIEPEILADFWNKILY